MSEIYGLLGRGISYSRSPEIHKSLWADDYCERQYILFDTTDLDTFVAKGKQMHELRGFNVTIPYKEAIIPFLDALEGDALATGAVNTVKCCPSGRWVGYNTDVTGFEELLEGMPLNTCSEVYVLGTGGASKAVVRAFQKRGMPSSLVSRHPYGDTLSYEALSQTFSPSSPKIIVNTTPLGSHLFPDELPPIPYHLLTPADTLIDLVYVPEETPFMKEGQRRGATVSNGLKMLWGQARAAQLIWAK